jgi:thiosulfate reductase cytochrome b subunit
VGAAGPPGSSGSIPFSVIAYGGNAGGSVDNSAAVTAACAANSEVYFPVGTYNFTANYTVPCATAYQAGAALKAPKWFAVLTGLVYLVSGIFTQHFRNEMLPARGDLSWRSFRSGLLDHLRFKRPVEDGSYNLVQRLSYLGVVFVLFPLTIMTGFAMSPAITSVFPWLVIWGGQQSARTIHFVLADLLTLFVLVHVAMVIYAGFGSRMRAMITGRAASGKGSI